VKRTPAVSVCVRAYRDAEGLRRALLSALGQTFSDLEVVVSDDRGQLEHVVRELGDDRLRYTANPVPRGPAGNLARAVSLARGELIAILNEDDVLLPEFLATTVAALGADPAVGVVFTGVHWEGAGRRVPMELPYAPGRHDRFLAEILDHGIPASGALFRRETWVEGERRLPLRDDMVGDMTLWLRAAQDGWAFRFVDEPLAVIGLHPGQISWGDGLPARVVNTLRAFSFDDPAAERLRLARLSELLMACAGAQLRRGRLRRAMAEALAARDIAPRGLRPRHALAFTGLRVGMIRFVSAHPRLLAPALDVWRRVRPAVT
jgi:glycosyltransferase involved in cell wall biosynthesis